MKIMSGYAVIAATLACLVLVATQTSADRKLKSIGKKVERLDTALDFADHVEDGLEVAQSVNQTQAAAEVVRDGVGADDVQQIAKNTADDYVRDEAREGFFDVVQSEIEDQAVDHAKDKALSSVRKHL